MLADFKDLILSQSKHKTFHVDEMMTVTFNFLVKTLFHAISAKLASLNATVSSEGHISNFNASAVKSFFSSFIEADLAIDKNPLNGLKEYLELAPGTKLADVKSLTPRDSSFKLLGDSVGVKQLIKLLDGLRTHRVEYLKRIVGDKAQVMELLNWLPHVFIVFDEAQGLVSKLDDSVPM